MNYYCLTQQDIIQEGDEERTNWGTWEPVNPEWVGHRKGSIMSWKYKVRRSKKEAGDERNTL